MEHILIMGGIVFVFVYIYIGNIRTETKEKEGKYLNLSLGDDHVDNSLLNDSLRISARKRIFSSLIVNPGSKSKFIGRRRLILIFKTYFYYYVIRK